MRRLPIRLRLTLAFALAMAVVLAATGGFLYLRLTASLDEAIDESLETRLAEIASPGEETTIVPDGDPDERFFQLLDGSGRVVEASARLTSRSLLSRQELERAVEEGTVSTELDDVPGVAGRARVLASHVDTSADTYFVIVGASLEDRDETVRSFLLELLVVGPAALVLASLLGYGLASAALRPVEAMRVEADAISGSEPGRRLPLPATNDEIRRLGETLNEMLARLESALGRERAFVADAGHELRTPLALLQAELEVALRRPRTAEELEQALRSAAVEADRLARLAEDLLLLARSDQADVPLRLQRVSAASVLRAAADRFARRAQEAGRALEVDARTDAVLRADPGRLEQAVGKLVENALEHGGGDVRLGVEARDGRVELHVRDAGAGFPREFLGHAFDRFTQADEARTGRGSGLGLAIAQAIAAAHGGSAHAVNADGGGADVWLALPTP